LINRSLKRRQIKMHLIWLPVQASGAASQLAIDLKHEQAHGSTVITLGKHNGP
jgi:hypothetical protein